MHDLYRAGITLQGPEAKITCRCHPIPTQAPHPNPLPLQGIKKRYLTNALAICVSVSIIFADMFKEGLFKLGFLASLSTREGF